MNTFILEIFDDTGSKCTFYSVRNEGELSSEAIKFFTKYRSVPEYKETIQILANFIVRVIGNKKGAKESLFRFENSASALPPSGKHRIEELIFDFGRFPLRLYCYRISEQIVVLFNGGVKTSHTAQISDSSIYFHEANQYSKRIYEALFVKKDLIISSNGREINNSNKEIEIIL